MQTRLTIFVDPGQQLSAGNSYPNPN